MSRRGQRTDRPDSYPENYARRYASTVSAIRPKPVNMMSLKLSPEEGFVLSRIDGGTSVRELVALTGFEEDRIVGIVGRLHAEGALEVEGLPASGPRSTSPSSKSGAERDADALAAQKKQREEEAEAEAAAAEAEAEAEAAREGEEGEEKAEGEEGEETEAEQARNEADYRKIYMTDFANEPHDYRLKAAMEKSGADLLALCFDPDPQVINALLVNPHAGLQHARLVAFHHRTQMGLEGISRRADYIKDSLVQRRLLRNPQLPITILNKVMQPKLLLDVYKVAIDRDVPERTRGLVKEILRKKFTVAPSDEKASLLWKTEGRCLVVLVQVTLDMHTTNILCSKNNYSIIFIQNLARWGATPPALLAHLLKLNVVRRNVGLAKMLLKHPNVPGEAKRNFIR